jgi:hypothetical protein
MHRAGRKCSKLTMSNDAAPVPIDNEERLCHRFVKLGLHLLTLPIHFGLELCLELCLLGL